MESAIAQHLRCPRSQPRRLPDGFVVGYPGWSARHDATWEHVLMAYHGVQWKQADREKAEDVSEKLYRLLTSGDSADRLEKAFYVDPQGYETIVYISYWSNLQRYQRHKQTGEFAEWWNSSDREAEGIGIFREVFSPMLTHLETLFSSPDQLEGIGQVFGIRSELEVEEHGYWGSMRDRIPVSQTDELAPSGELSLAMTDQPLRVRVNGHENIAVIRSGQDWSQVSGYELEIYEQEMEPTLRAGMDFLSGRGVEIGCYANRYLQHVHPNGDTVMGSYGLSYWRSLADMEAWAEHHPTHVAIFDGFLKMVGTLGGVLNLRLYHEVMVLRAAEQAFEYVACHPRTGLLGALRLSPQRVAQR
jgi:aldoxime dehydratase